MTDRYLTHKGFNLKVSLQDIRVSSSNNSVTFTPAEAEKAKNILSMAASMGVIAESTPFITNSPFRVIFEEDSEGVLLILTRRGQKQGEGLRFRMGQIDRLVQAINTALDMHVDTQVHRTGANPDRTRAAFATPEPTFEGRE